MRTSLATHQGLGLDQLATGWERRLEGWEGSVVHALIGVLGSWR